MICRIWVVGVFSAGMAMGQAATLPPAAAPAKTLAFDVVSIRQNTSTPNQMGPPVFGPTPDGYRMVNVPLFVAIMSAYPPQSGGAGALFMPNNIRNLPDWVMQQRYDIDAKVAEDDLAEWQKPVKQTAMLQTMLQSLLTDRCKLQVHHESKDSPVYLLTVGKSGPKFKEVNPADPAPVGVTLPGGAVMAQTNDGMRMYNATMGTLTTMLSSMGVGGGLGRPVLDKTGLGGRYDIILKRQDMMPPPASPGDASSAPDPVSMVMSVADALGLKLESGKGQVETLVVDHMEKPSEN
jgi:uncharacterized protein (TIGR03435 family)